MKTYLNVWEKGGKVRVYINGHNRSKTSRLYLYEGKDGTIYTGSQNLDQPNKYVGGDVYGKREKDRKAAIEVLTSYGWNFGQKFADLLTAVKNKELVQIITSE